MALMGSDRQSYELLLKERDDWQREAQTVQAELYSVLKQSDYRSGDELALDCMARMAIEAQQMPLPEFPADLDEVRVKIAVAEEIINGSEPEQQKRARTARRRISDQTYEYDKLAQATTQLRQVEREIEGKEWTTKMVTELSKALMDLKETLMNTQNKAAEIEIGSALHKHVVSAVQNAEVLEGTPDVARIDRVKMSEALDHCLKMVADRRSEMMLDDIGHGDIESWIAKWEDRMAKDASDVMTAARALDERMKLEVDSHMRAEREIDNVEIMVEGKEQFVRKMNDIRNRTLSERDGLVQDQRRYDQVRAKLDSMFQHKHTLAEQKLMEVRTRKGECRDRLEQYREELVRLMNCIKSESASINALSSIENETLAIQQENLRVKASIQSSLQELKTGQALLSKDLNQKVKGVELALARGCNILDAVMTRKHERETELDSRCRDMFLSQHESSVKMYRYLFQVIADKEDKREQLIDTLETHKYHFEQAVKVANFSEIGRLKELMKRTDMDIARVSQEISDHAAVLTQRYRALWDLERVLYQRFKYSDTGAGGSADDMTLNQLQEQAGATVAPFESTVTFQPKPKGLEPFLVMRFDPNILRNPSFNEGRQGWQPNDSSELALRESADHNHCCVVRCIASGQGVLLQQRDVGVQPEREYMLCVRSAMANAERVMSVFVERQDSGAPVGSGRLIAQKSVQMSPGVLQVGLRLRFCTGTQDTMLRVCCGMKAEPGDELTVSQIVLQPLQFVEVLNPHSECGIQRVEQQMMKEDEKDKHERAKMREQQRKRQTLLDQRENLETAARSLGVTTHSAGVNRTILSSGSPMPGYMNDGPVRDL